jgi:predicted aldo/keto reductase-like oxidoreductase
MLCSICFNDIPSVQGWDSGNNADPINMGRCCNKCDNNVVIPARLTMMTRRISNEQYREMQRLQFEALREIFEPVAK